MFKKLYFWTEEYLFVQKTVLQKAISLLLLPLSFFWCIGGYIKKFTKKPKDLGVAIIGIGNLTIGGSGKTPIAIAIAKRAKNVAIVLRGYGRKSKGLVVVSINGKLQTDVATSGDEAMLYAMSLQAATVIVSEDRASGILKAKELGAQVVILDDAFSKFDILKFDILLKPKINYTKRCIPSGAYRLPVSMEKYANCVWVEDIDFKRKTTVQNETDTMVLVTAIANASRLDKFLPSSVVAKYILQDHAYFNECDLLDILNKTGAKSILVTQKDLVKMQGFNLPISVLNLDLEFKDRAFDKLESYLSGFQISLDKIS